MRRILAIAALMIVVAAGCGDDGGGSGNGGGDAEAFCDRLRELDAEESVNLEDEDGLAALTELIDIAPQDVADNLEELADAAQELNDLDEDDPESFGAAFEIFLDPRVLDAISEFGQFAEDECGIEIQGTDIDPDNPLGDLTDDFSSDFSADFSSDFGTDAGGPSDTELLQAFLEENYGDEPWVDLISSRSTGTLADISVNVTLQMDEGVDAESAVSACEASLAWAEDAGFEEAEAEIQNTDLETLADGDLAGGCEGA